MTYCGIFYTNVPAMKTIKKGIIKLEQGLRQ
jgi:hypothetical protein